MDKFLSLSMYILKYTKLEETLVNYGETIKYF